MKSLQFNQPHLLILAGIPGSGRTTFAVQFAELFHAPYVNVKDFTDLVADTDRLPQLGMRLAQEFFKTGQTVLYEGLSGTRAERQEIAKLARDAGYTPLVLWFQVNEASAKSRVAKKKRNTHPSLAEIYEQYKFTEPSQRETYVVISGMRTYPSQAKTVLRRLIELNGRNNRTASSRTAETDSTHQTSNRRSITVG